MRISRQLTVLILVDGRSINQSIVTATYGGLWVDISLFYAKNHKNSGKDMPTKNRCLFSLGQFFVN